LWFFRPAGEQSVWNRKTPIRIVLFRVRGRPQTETETNVGPTRSDDLLADEKLEIGSRRKEVHAGRMASAGMERNFGYSGS